MELIKMVYPTPRGPSRVERRRRELGLGAFCGPGYDWQRCRCTICALFPQILEMLVAGNHCVGHLLVILALDIAKAHFD